MRDYSQSFTAKVVLYYDDVTGGHGYIACKVKTGETFGEQEPTPEISASVAYYGAIFSLQAAGVRHGRIAVYAPDGKMVAYTRLEAGGSYSSLEFEEIVEGWNSF